jgi:hypothetical protein
MNPRQVCSLVLAGVIVISRRLRRSNVARGASDSQTACIQQAAGIADINR